MCNFTKDDEPPEDEVLLGQASLTEAKWDVGAQACMVSATG